MRSLSAAYVFAGGRSTRMGRDKALLPWPDPDSPPLAKRIAAIAQTAAGTATLVGDPDLYGHLGFPVIPDLHPGLGPLSGVEAALTRSDADWNLILACDLPNLTVEFLVELVDRKAATVATTFDQPAICAVLPRGCLKDVRAAIAHGELAWCQFVDTIGAIRVPAQPPQLLANINFPKDLAAHE